MGSREGRPSRPFLWKKSQIGLGSTKMWSSYGPWRPRCPACEEWFHFRMKFRMPCIQNAVGVLSESFRSPFGSMLSHGARCAGLAAGRAAPSLCAHLARTADPLQRETHHQPLRASRQPYGCEEFYINELILDESLL